MRKLYLKTEVLIGVLSAALIRIFSRGVNCIRNVWKQNKKIKISQVFSTYAEVEQKKGVPPEMERRIEKYARIGRRLDKLIQKTLDDSKTV